MTPQELQRLARHANIKTTLKFYVHLSTRDLASAIGKVAASRSAAMGGSAKSGQESAQPCVEGGPEGGKVREAACAIPSIGHKTDRDRTGRDDGRGEPEGCASTYAEAAAASHLAVIGAPTMTERDETKERPERDLNPRITDLQSVPLGHLGIRPW